ncbi:hypothetical protein PspLS_09351 [Pyricularia sp. CBS 133598]|nr:hypothetical protein PspLS_09351 [Pyricularia sp. CBS 133598]
MRQCCDTMPIGSACAVYCNIPSEIQRNDENNARIAWWKGCYTNEPRAWASTAGRTVPCASQGILRISGSWRRAVSRQVVAASDRGSTSAMAIWSLLAGLFILYGL